MHFEVKWNVCINICFLSCGVPEWKWHWLYCAAIKMKTKRGYVPNYNSKLILNHSLMFLICGILHCRLESMPGSSSIVPRQSWRAPPGPRPGFPGRSCPDRSRAALQPYGSSCAKPSWWELAQTFFQWTLPIRVPVLMEEENINNQLSLLTLWIITLVRVKMAYFSQVKRLLLCCIVLCYFIGFLFTLYIIVYSR